MSKMRTHAQKRPSNAVTQSSPKALQSPYTYWPSAFHRPAFHDIGTKASDSIAAPIITPNLGAQSSSAAQRVQRTIDTSNLKNLTEQQALAATVAGMSAPLRHRYEVLRRSQAPYTIQLAEREQSLFLPASDGGTLLFATKQATTSDGSSLQIHEAATAVRAAYQHELHSSFRDSNKKDKDQKDIGFLYLESKEPLIKTTFKDFNNFIDLYMEFALPAANSAEFEPKKLANLKFLLGEVQAANPGLSAKFREIFEDVQGNVEDVQGHVGAFFKRLWKQNVITKGAIVTVAAAAAYYVGRQNLKSSPSSFDELLLHGTEQLFESAKFEQKIKRESGLPSKKTQSLFSGNLTEPDTFKNSLKKDSKGIGVGGKVSVSSHTFESLSPDAGLKTLEKHGFSDKRVWLVAKTGMLYDTFMLRQLVRRGDIKLDVIVIDITSEERKLVTVSEIPFVVAKNLYGKEASSVKANVAGSIFEDVDDDLLRFSFKTGIHFKAKQFSLNNTLDTKNLVKGLNSPGTTPTAAMTQYARGISYELATKISNTFPLGEQSTQRTNTLTISAGLKNTVHSFDNHPAFNGSALMTTNGLTWKILDKKAGRLTLSLDNVFPINLSEAEVDSPKTTAKLQLLRERLIVTGAVTIPHSQSKSPEFKLRLLFRFP